MPFLLLITEGHNFSVDDIDWSTPNEMKPYEEMHALKLKQNHRQAWLEGLYIQEAFGVILGNAFSKKGAKKLEYPDEPLCDKRELTPEEMEERNIDLFNAIFEQLKTIKPVDDSKGG